MLNRNSTPPLTIIIPNYNGKQLLEKNLPTVCEAVEYYSGPANIVVVDDASNESGTLELVKRFALVEYVQHEENRGFSEAVLTGVKLAKNELLLFLNSDVSPAVDFIQPLINAMLDEKVFAVSPLIINDDNSVNRYSLNLKKWHCCDLKSVKWTMEQVLQSRKNGPIEHLFCSGGSMLTRRSMFLTLGGFAPIFKPYYSEDKDLGVRAWRYGWKSLFEPESQVIHQETGSIEKSEKAAYVKLIQRRNRFFFEWSHLSLPRLFCYRGPYWLKQIVGRSLRGDLIYLKGLGQALIGIKDVLKHRALVDKNSKDLNFEQLIEKLDSTF